MREVFRLRRRRDFCSRSLTFLRSFCHMLRKFIFWSHLAVGVVVGLIVLVLCLTGVLLSFERPSLEWMEGSRLNAPPAGNGDPLPADELAARVAPAAHASLSSLRFRNNPNAPVRIQLSGVNFICANAYTGQVIGPSAPGLRAFYKTVRNLHTALTLQNGAATTGTSIVDACNLGFVFLTLSGLVLWWPANWRWRALRNSVTVRLDVRGKTRDWNWHNALGFWGFIPLFIMAGSGIVLSYKTADDSVRSFAREHIFTHSKAPLTYPAPAAATPAARKQPDWRKILAAAEQAVPGWRSMTVPWNGNKQSLVNIQITPGQDGEAMRSITLTIDKASATVVKIQKWENNDAGLRARLIMRLSHSGELGGLPGQTVAALGCLAGIVLVYTGFALSWWRFFSRRRRGKAAPPLLGPEQRLATQAASVRVS